MDRLDSLSPYYHRAYYDWLVLVEDSPLMSLLKTFYVEHYQRWRWYESFTVAEYSKFVNIISPTLVVSLLTWMKVNGWQISLWDVLIGYVILNVAAILVGKILVEMGIASYNNKLANEQNRELMRILEIVEDLNKRL